MKPSSLMLPIVLTAALVSGCSHDSDHNSSDDNGSPDPSHLKHWVEVTDNGGGDASPRDAWVDDGKQFTTTITPEHNYRIKTVSGDNCSLIQDTVTDGTVATHYHTDALDKDCTIDVEFTPITAPELLLKSITVHASEHGTATPVISYAEIGTRASFTLTPDDNYRVQSISAYPCHITAAAFDGRYTTDAIEQHCAIYAAFTSEQQLAWPVTVEGDNVQVDPSITYIDNGKVATFTITPNSNYKITEVSGSTCDVSLIDTGEYQTGPIFERCDIAVEAVAVPAPLVCNGEPMTKIDEEMYQFALNNPGTVLVLNNETIKDTIALGLLQQGLVTFNTACVTHMDSLFRRADDASHGYNSATFNADISGWDVSQVTSMAYMFNHAESFNQDISGWEVSKVTNMLAMFDGAESFNHDISSWDVSSVKNMSSMFYDALDFDQDLSGWEVSNVTIHTRFANHLKSEYQPNFSN